MTQKGEQTRDNILLSARSLIKRKGFAATTINDLLEVSGTTKGNLYFHFADKEAVGLEVLKREQKAFRAFLDRCFSCDDPLESLDLLFSGALEKNRREAFVGGCLFGNIALEASDSLPLFAAIVNEVFSEWTARLQEVIAQGQKQGVITTKRSAAELAELVVATIEGGIMQSRLRKSEQPLKQMMQTLKDLILI